MEIEKKESNPDPTPSCWGSLDRDRDRIAGFARDQGDISTLRDRVTFLFCVDSPAGKRRDGGISHEVFENFLGIVSGLRERMACHIQ